MDRRRTFSPDGNRLLVVVGGRSMTIWDVRSGAKVVSFPEAGNTGTTVVSTDFSPDGSRLISVSSDGEVWLWDAGSGKGTDPAFSRRPAVLMKCAKLRSWLIRSGLHFDYVRQEASLWIWL